MKFQFIFLFISLFFTLNAYSLSGNSCSCSYSQSAGHTEYVSPGATVTFTHTWGSGGTCTATCTSTCQWINKSDGCNGFVLLDNLKALPKTR
jgi:hypothetical protein